jgi:WD40 repeat protein
LQEGTIGWLLGLLATLLIGYVRFVVGLRTRLPREPAWAEEWSTLLNERDIRRPVSFWVTDQLGPMLCRLPAGYRLSAPASGMRDVMIGDDRESFATFAASPDGRLLAGGSSGFGSRGRMIRFWEVATGRRLNDLKPVRDFERRPDSVIWIDFSSDGRTLFSLNGDPGNRPETLNKGRKGIL